MSKRMSMDFELSVEQLSEIASQAVNSGMKVAVFHMEFDHLDSKRLDDGSLSVGCSAGELSVSYHEDFNNRQS